MKYERKLNLIGLTCPLPVLKTQLALQALQPGEVLWVLTSDAQSADDLPALVAQQQDFLRHACQKGEEYHFFIEKMTG